MISWSSEMMVPKWLLRLRSAESSFHDSLLLLLILILYKVACLFDRQAPVFGFCVTFTMLYEVINPLILNRFLPRPPPSPPRMPSGSLSSKNSGKLINY